MAGRRRSRPNAEESRRREADNLLIGQGTHTARMLDASMGGQRAWVVKIDDASKVPPSTQIRDPFQGLYAEGLAMQPPLPPERLLQLAEENSVHGACLWVKSIDAAGRGWHWEAEDPEDEQAPRAPVKPGAPTAEAPEVEGKQVDDTAEFTRTINKRLEEITPDYTFTEMLIAAAWELDAIGWAAWEIIRATPGDQDSDVAAIYPIPAHTLRATADEDKYVQLRGGRLRYFTRFGRGKVIDRDSGRPFGDAAPPRPRQQSGAGGKTEPAGLSGQPKPQRVGAGEPAAEVLVFKAYASRSIFYGIPKWIDVIPALAELTAVREFNVSWFSSGGQQDRSIHVTAKDAQVAEKTALDIVNQMNANQGVAHQTLITHGSEDVKVAVSQLDVQTREGHFRLRRGDLIKEVLMGHAVPPYRIGWAELGSLGGSAAKEMLDAYRFGSVKPIQTVLEDRLNQTLFGPRGLQTEGYLFRLEDLDFGELEVEMTVIEKAVENAVMSPNEGRERLGMDRDDDNPAMDVKFMKGVPLAEVTSAGGATDVIEQLRAALAAALGQEAGPDGEGAPVAAPGAAEAAPGRANGTRPRGTPPPGANGALEPATASIEAALEGVRKSADAMLEEFKRALDEGTARIKDSMVESVLKAIGRSDPPQAGTTHVHVPPPDPPTVRVGDTTVEVAVPRPRPVVRDIERDDQGRITRVIDRPSPEEDAP